MGWSATDFIELLDEADLPEPTEVVCAWWVGIGPDDYACGMIVRLVDSSQWYLECLRLDGEHTYAKPKKVTAAWSKPKSQVLVTTLTWNVPTAPISTEMDIIYCRVRDD